MAKMNSVVGRKMASVNNRFALVCTAMKAIADRFVGTYRLRDFPTERFFVSRTADGGLYWARVGHIGRDLLPENAGRLFSPDSKMTLDAIGEKAGKAVTLELSFGGGKNIAERVE